MSFLSLAEASHVPEVLSTEVMYHHLATTEGVIEGRTGNGRAQGTQSSPSGNTTVSNMSDSLGVLPRSFTTDLCLHPSAGLPAGRQKPEAAPSSENFPQWAETALPEVSKRLHIIPRGGQ